ncbi:hypothetical protein IMCC3135_33515 [Granulosicoccus antarcticus IMCC3135]|uniref:Uncharacterized protein n=2 Tax=Granulosicoccus TaxID=437504 RepID=A0A2Z2P7U5_9GAMM|nr:hypothetical protein IMCC3135_33515 [Granulosicoccus antarcticus IMCC3135]
MERSSENELIIQYAVIAIHNALQGAVTVALREADISDTWKNSHAKKWENVELPKQLATGGMYQPDKFPQLNVFMDLYDKYFNDKCNSIDRERIENLNKHRNEFIHFNTDYLSIEKQWIIDSCREGIEAISHIVKEEKQLFGNEYNFFQEILKEAKQKV